MNFSIFNFTVFMYNLLTEEKNKNYANLGPVLYYLVLVI